MCLPHSNKSNSDAEMIDLIAFSCFVFFVCSPFQVKSPFQFHPSKLSGEWSFPVNEKELRGLDGDEHKCQQMDDNK